ncbi:hypothetical protein [Vagococcus fessus]|uniref:Uncharacterized protein n=1 Tax=Vagococcus fessus TaxID=120370 RepID=A0A430A552_9ENTE|nr:hypothetical protein [Vagococcus fessus]RSU01938.1 hypothetical protein CBF31_09220 [Vagococcus fessus]
MANKKGILVSFVYGEGCDTCRGYHFEENPNSSFDEYTMDIHRVVNDKNIKFIRFGNKLVNTDKVSSINIEQVDLNKLRISDLLRNTDK